MFRSEYRLIKRERAMARSKSCEHFVKQDIVIRVSAWIHLVAARNLVCNNIFLSSEALSLTSWPINKTRSERSLSAVVSHWRRLGDLS
jgi:hypothetical protein